MKVGVKVCCHGAVETAPRLPPLVNSSASHAEHDLRFISTKGVLVAECILGVIHCYSTQK
ncbi:hypothetical protein EYF80_049659 [Liparis tanakae]|uniref:Uncharacterized protein n=1 Tax=Liparis tanakae TaxID=230148 RepID=A0A4Z2FGZ4_9TELE|nr:hypothetical protein EYF80_049659 [Liparis tanakae]